MSLTAKNLTLDLLLAAGSEPLPVRHLLAAAALFGIPANNLRVALARLSSDGMIESVGRGTYQLTASANELAADVATWRSACERVRPWQGGHVTVNCGALGRSDRAALRHRERALNMLGLKELDRGLFVRPDNLQGGIDEVRRRLYTLGLERDASVFVATDFDSERNARLHALWDGTALNDAYGRLESQLAEWTARAHQLTIEDAARESYLLGRKAIRQVVFDPLLPAPLVDVDARQRFVHAVLAFDQLGRGIWQQFHAWVDEPALGAPTTATSAPSLTAH
ncbi:MAG: PaaX family transcriptional regulator [Rubrivivax sp.]|nr:MAG: PaaX family transcriptional regulator [Rubrivivax sp.]